MIQFEIENTIGKFVEKAPAVLRSKAVSGAQRTASKVLARMEAAAPRFTGAMASRLTTDGGLVGIFNDPEEASVALFNEYSPNHQPFMRPALQASAGDLVEAVSEAMAEAEHELAE